MVYWWPEPRYCRKIWWLKKGIVEWINFCPVARSGEYCIYCWLLNKSRHSLLLLHTLALYLEFYKIISCWRFPCRSCWIRLSFPSQKERMKLFLCFWPYLITAWLIFKTLLVNPLALRRTSGSYVLPSDCSRHERDGHVHSSGNTNYSLPTGRRELNPHCAELALLNRVMSARWLSWKGMWFQQDEYLWRFSVSNIFYKFITMWEGIGRFLDL